jgi:hypothetical protein
MDDFIVLKNEWKLNEREREKVKQSVRLGETTTNEPISERATFIKAIWKTKKGLTHSCII